jgi:FAD/FMN-containing dehydrogenase
MTLLIAPDELARLAAQADSPCRKQLIAALKSAPAEVSATKTVRAADLLPAYRVRRARFQEEGLPPSEGLPELVDALERHADREVVIAAYHAAGTTFVLLFAATLDELLGCAAIKDR